MTGRPVRLTFPPYDVGAADILAGGRSVGFCLDEGGGRWRAYLYPAAQDRRTPRPDNCEEVTARTLADLRRQLRERFEPVPNTDNRNPVQDA
jgi:hypothetical protein